MVNVYGIFYATTGVWEYSYLAMYCPYLRTGVRQSIDAARTVCSLRKNCMRRVKEHIAPTANFKTNVDGEGKTQKYKMRRLEHAEVEGARGKNARGVFEVLKLHMEEPPTRDIYAPCRQSLGDFSAWW
jgi:hypothetical protein